MMIKKFLAAACIAISAMGLMGASAQDSIVGQWKTIDDVTGYPKSIIEISETPSHTFTATVRKIFPVPGAPVHETCVACTGEKHNQPIIGMTILTGLKSDSAVKGHYIDGEILDPHNGKSYHCNMQLENNNEKLNVRGYIGLPLFGRTQTWIRMTGS